MVYPPGHLQAAEQRCCLDETDPASMYAYSNGSTTTSHTQVEVSQCSLCILAFSLVFTPYLSDAVVLVKSPHYFHALVALKMLVSLISRLVACSPRIVVDKQTDR